MIHQFIINVLWNRTHLGLLTIKSRRDIQSFRQTYNLSDYLVFVHWTVLVCTKHYPTIRSYIRRTFTVQNIVPPSARTPKGLLLYNKHCPASRSYTRRPFPVPNASHNFIGTPNRHFPYRPDIRGSHIVLTLRRCFQPHNVSETESGQLVYCSLYVSLNAHILLRKIHAWSVAESKIITIYSYGFSKRIVEKLRGASLWVSGVARGDK